MERGEVLRRMVHMCAVFFLVYYLLPDEVFGDLAPGFYKWQGVLYIMIISLVFEIVRLKKKKVFFGLRPYEKDRISAFAWFTMAMGTALLVYDFRFVVPVVCGMAFFDPLCGEIKHRNSQLYPFLPAVVYACIAFLTMFLVAEFSMPALLVLTCGATLSAVFAEMWDIKIVDDDFLLIMIPLSVLTVLDFLLTL